MVTGWKQIDKKWYYFTTAGNMIANESVKSGGKVYLLGDSGAMVTKKGWAKIKGSSTPDRYAWFYLKSGGVCTTGWKKIGSKWYYFDFYGPMLCNTTREIDGKNYKFNKSGVCTNP